MKAVTSNYRATDEAGGDERGSCRQFTELLIEEGEAGGSGERLALCFAPALWWWTDARSSLRLISSPPRALMSKLTSFAPHSGRPF